MSGGVRLRATVEGPEQLVVELDPTEVAPDRAAWLSALRPTDVDRVEGRRRFEVVVDGWRFEVAVEPAALAVLRERARRGAAGSRPHARAPVLAQIPGRIVAVHVAAGDQVAAGDRLLSIEAMKMENDVRSARPGTIAAVAVAAGDRVELGDELVVIE